MEDLEKFKDYMNENTTLASSSILLYIRTINSFFKEYSVLSEENINAFINKHSKNKSSYHTKFSFKYYLKFLKNPVDYDNLIKVKIQPRKKLKKFYSEETIKKIIKSISKVDYRVVAMLQFATGARQFEILTMKTENIDFEYDGAIRIRLIGKGNKEGMTFLSKEFEAILRNYTEKNNVYLFLDNSFNFLSKEEFERKLASERVFYYRELKKSAESVGIFNFSSHNFRRSVADILRKKGVDLFAIKKILRHKNIQTTTLYFDESEEETKDNLLNFQEKKNSGVFGVVLDKPLP